MNMGHGGRREGQEP
jgi:hypothetical protein